jgi:hypothetical protein
MPSPSAKPAFKPAVGAGETMHVALPLIIVTAAVLRIGLALLGFDSVQASRTCCGRSCLGGLRAGSQPVRRWEDVLAEHRRREDALAAALERMQARLDADLARCATQWQAT